MTIQYAGKRKLAFWVVSFVIVILLALHVLFSTKVTGYSPSDFGLITKLPVTYWIGLSCLGLLLYVSRKSERPTIVVVLLITFFLFFIPVLVRENMAEGLPISVARASQGTFLLSEGGLDFSTLNPWDLRNWPGFFFIAAFLEAVTGLPATVFADFFPPLTITLLGLIAFSIFRLRFNTLHSSLGVLWIIGSFWTGQHYFSSSAISYLMYAAIFLLITISLFSEKQNIAIQVSIIVLFIGAVISHLLASFMIMAGVIAVYASYKILSPKAKKLRLSIVSCILLINIFLAYQALFLQRSFTSLLTTLYAQLVSQDTHLAIITQTRVFGSLNLQLERFATYGITIINLILGALAILALVVGLLLRKKEIKNDASWIAWIIVAGVFGVAVQYGGEAINRALMFSLLPIAYFAVKYLRKRPRILFLGLIILIILNIPATFIKENRNYVPTSEMQGTNFYVKHAPQTSSFFYEILAPFLPYNETENMGPQIGIQAVQSLYSLPSDDLIKEITEKAEFVMSSDAQRNFYNYFFGFDLLENLNLDNSSNRIYDNGGFRIYSHVTA